MPLDIFIEGNNERSEMLPLFIEEYDILMEKLENESDFPITKEKLSDYYGENEIYLDELESLKEEIERLKDFLKIGYSSELLSFLNRFYDLIEDAIRKRKTIKLIGD